MNSNYLILYLHVYWLLLELAIKFCWEQCYASCSKLACWHSITCNIVKQFVLVNLNCSYCDNISQMMRLNCTEMSFFKDPRNKGQKPGFRKKSHINKGTRHQSWIRRLDELWDILYLIWRNYKYNFIFLNEN